MLNVNHNRLLRRTEKMLCYDDEIIRTINFLSRLPEYCMKPEEIK